MKKTKTRECTYEEYGVCDCPDCYKVIDEPRVAKGA